MLRYMYNMVWSVKMETTLKHRLDTGELDELK